jgi:hypothetical protein
VEWDAGRARVGDPWALAAGREAERLLARERAAGAQASRLQGAGPAARLVGFDPEAETIVIVPRAVGG